LPQEILAFSGKLGLDLSLATRVRLRNLREVRMKISFQILAALFFCPFSQTGAANPPMTRIVSRFFSPEIKPDSFAAKPKILYIAGTSYSRTEEEPDPEQHLHALLIANEPDVWD
jgi:hypothetical protein